MKTLRIAVLLPLLAAFVAVVNPPCAAGQEKVNRAKLVDKWEITESDNPAARGSTLEFTKAGTLILMLKFGDQELPIVGKYAVSGGDLKFTTKGPDQREKSDTVTVEKLTDTDLVLKDDQGKVTKHKKAK